MLTVALLSFGVYAPGAALPSPDCTVERVLPFSSVEIEAALRSIHAYSGDRLPTVEGFAASSEAPLGLFKRGYFQYALQVVPDGEAARLRVCAKITAWLDAADSTPGYRQLASNGRLEADLFDRVNDAIKTLPLASSTPEFSSSAASEGQSASSLDSSTKDATGNGGGDQIAASGPTRPMGASASEPAVNADTFSVPQSNTVPSYASVHSGDAVFQAEEKEIRTLTTQARALEQVLGSQSHPDNLVSVKHAHSPVFEHPVEGAHVLLYAQAEDEFQKQGETGAWVQVRISGASTGWIRRSQLELQLESQALDRKAAHESPSPAPIPDQSLPAVKPAQHMTEQVSLFPGKWQPLDGKQVEVISLQPDNSAVIPNKKVLSTSVFRKAYQQISGTDTGVAGVVIIFDSADGLMAAATKESLQQLELGQLSNSAFWERCYLDPKDAFLDHHKDAVRDPARAHK